MSKFDDEDDGFPAEATVEKPQQKPPPAIALDWPVLATKVPPPRRWAIKGWLGYGHTTLLVGSGGIGKTLIAQQIGSALAIGQAFIEPEAEPTRVLMWACEDDHDELWRRQLDIARYLKVGLEELGNFTLIPRHGKDNALAVNEFNRLAFTPLIGELEQQAKDLNAEVVILDNVAQLYGAGENDRHAVTAFLNNLSGALPGRAILLLAHPSRSAESEFSGSGAWENVARTRLYLGSKLPGQKTDPDAVDDQDARFLCRRKANYSSKDYRQFRYENGVLVPEIVQDASGMVGVLKAQHTEKVVLEAIQKLASMGIYANEGTRSPLYLPTVIVQYQLGNGQTKPELAQAMRKLLTDGKLTKAIVGKNANRTPKEGLVVAQ